MRIDILTLFPEICRAPLNESMMKRAQEGGMVELRIHNLRDWTTDKHRVVDDAPFGGGQGMLMKPEPIFAAVETLSSASSTVIFMTPQGRRFDQEQAVRFSHAEHLIVLCGHYEGVDHRVVDQLVDAEISIGDYVLTNGALAAAVFADAVVRLLPGVLGHELMHLFVNSPNHEASYHNILNEISTTTLGFYPQGPNTTTKITDDDRINTIQMNKILKSKYVPS